MNYQPCKKQTSLLIHSLFSLRDCSFFCIGQISFTPHTLDRHGLTLSIHVPLEPGIQYIYVTGSDGRATEQKETEHDTVKSQLQRGALGSQPWRGWPWVKKLVCVCSTFAGSGLFTELLTEEMSESSIATTSAGHSIPGPSPRYWATINFVP